MSGQSRTQLLKTWLGGLSWVRRFGRGAALVGIALLISLVAEATGLVGALDRAMHRHYYDASAARTSGQRVLLVAADEDTVAAWGPPPWNQARLTELYRSVDAGNPSVVAVMGRERVFLADAGAPPAALRESVERGDLLLDVDPGLGTADPGATDTVQLAVDGRTGLARVLGQTALRPRSGDDMEVRYLVPPKSLPTLSARRVAAGDIPSSTFTGRIVVVGLTDPQHTIPVQTPVGPLTAAQVASHALLAVADDATWWVVPRVLSLAIRVGLVIGLLFGLRRTMPRTGAIAAASLAAGLVFADYLAFSTGFAVAGASGHVIACVALAGAHWFDEHRRATATLSSLTQRMAEEVSSASVEGGEGQRRRWQDLAEMGHAYLGREATGILAELPAGKWHLEARAFVGMDTEAFTERRRDVRRAPFRASYLTLRSSRAERRVVSDGEQWTQVVPLCYEGRLYGVWMINLPEDVTLTESDVREMESIGLEIGHAIARMRSQAPGSQVLGGVAPLHVRRQIDLIRRGIEVLHQGREWGGQVLENLPVGLLVATVWGQIRDVNQRMRDRLADEFPDGVPDDDLRAVLARATGGTLSKAHDLMRTVVREGTDVHFSPSGDVLGEVSERPTYILTRFSIKPAAEGTAGATTSAATDGDAGSDYLLLIARSDLDDAANRPSKTA